MKKMGKGAALTLALAATLLLAPAAKPATAAPAAATAGHLTGVRADVQFFLDRAENQLISLASVVPPDKFSWRPAPGVRSFGEVCLHVAGGNYEMGAIWGMKPPPNLDLTKIEKQGADKGNAVAAMRVSFARVRESSAAMPDSDLDRAVDYFGHPGTVRQVLIAAVSHADEHLGQLIAYARMNGIVPPWTAAEQHQTAPPPHH
jgi:uncharacterized damage-inducible protein DinB